jgi:hypothetical protein
METNKWDDLMKIKDLTPDEIEEAHNLKMERLKDSAIRNQ